MCIREDHIARAQNEKVTRLKKLLISKIVSVTKMKKTEPQFKKNRAAQTLQKNDFATKQTTNVFCKEYVNVITKWS